MIRTRGRKILRDVFSRKTRTVLVSASIFVGVLGVIALLTVRDLVTRQLEEDVQEDRLTMIDVYVSLKSGAEADNDLVLQTLNQENETGQAIRELDGIQHVEGQVYFPIEFRKPADADYTEAEIRAYSASLQEVQLEPMRLQDGGAWPTPGNNEIVLETRMADRYGFDVGDTIVFRTPTGDITYTVTGLIFHPYSYKQTSTTGSLTPGPEDGIYAQYEDLQALLDFNGFNRIVARYETFDLAEQRFEDFQNVIREYTPYLPQFPLLENPAENGQIFNAETFGNILSLLAIVAMIVSSFLVINVVNTIVVEQRRQVGALKSLGATRLDNFLIYAGIALVYGVIGTLFAIIPGILLGYRFALVLAPQLDVLIEGFKWSPLSVVMGIVMGVVVPVLASAIPVYTGTRVTIIEAMTDLGIDSTYGQGRTAHFIGGLPLPTSIRQTISNIFQKKGRLTLTGITLTSAIGASMGVFATGISLNSAVNDIFDRLNYEITVIPTELQDIETTHTTLESLDIVVEANPGVILSVQVEGNYENFFTRNNQIVVFGIDPAANDYEFHYEDGIGWRNDPERDGVVISAPMADQLEVKAGDTITFVVGGNRVTETLIGIEGAAFDALWIKWDRIAALAGYTDDTRQFAQINLPGFDSTVWAVGIDDNLANLLIESSLPENAVIITEPLAAITNLAEGDELSASIEDQFMTRTIAATIPHERLTAILDEYDLEFPFVPQEIIFFSLRDLGQLTGATGQPVPNGYYVATTLNEPTAEDVDDVIETVEAALVANGVNSEIQNQVEQFQEISDLIVQYTAILSVSAILIAAVGAIGLLTTLTINVFERQKEIGVMRSIGASSRTVAVMFMLEGMLVGFGAWLVGIPISYGLALMLNAAFRLETVKFSYPPEVLVLGLAGMLLIAALASLGPSLSAARKTVSEILRYQ